MQFRGHRNEPQCIQKVTSTHQQRVPCTMELAEQNSKRQSNLQLTYAQLLVEYSATGAHLDGCTLNFNIHTGDEYIWTKSKFKCNTLPSP